MGRRDEQNVEDAFTRWRAKQRTPIRERYARKTFAEIAQEAQFAQAVAQSMLAQHSMIEAERLLTKSEGDVADVEEAKRVIEAQSRDITDLRREIGVVRREAEALKAAPALAVHSNGD